MLRRTLVALVPLLLAAESAPPPPLAEAAGQVDGKPERARLERDGTLVVDDADGRELARVALPQPRRIERAEVRFVPVENTVVVHARAALGRGQAAEAILAGRKSVWTGVTGPVGDGERSELLRVDADGIVRYQTTPGFERCDGDKQLFPERWDFAGGRFRPVSDEPPAGRRLRAGTDTPMGLGAPPLRLFRFVAASTDASGVRRADQLAAPRELEDGAPATAWHAGFDGAARGAWATARAQAVTPKVRALQIVGGKESPRTLAIVLGPASDQQFTVDVGPGVRWVMLPELAPTACVSVAVAEPGPRNNDVAEVAIYTDVDGPEGIARLVDEVAELRANGDGAAHVLAGHGVAAAQAIADKLPTTHGQGRRRLLQVLAAIGSDVAAPAMGKALETAEPEDRPILVAALAKMGAAGAREAIRVYGDAAQAGEARADAATVLGLVPGNAEALAALLAGAGSGEPAVRVATMHALARAYADAPAAVERALVAGGADARVGDLARAIGAADRRGGARPEATAALATAWRRTTPSQFELRLRLVRAIGDAGDAGALGPLGEAARDGEPVLRAAAASAAARVGGGAAIARGVAGDGDAGVRRAALVALAGRPDAAELDEAALGRDGWPMVRRAAAASLGALCVETRAPPRASLARAVNGEGRELRGADPSEEVRREALAALGRCRDVPLATFVAALGERRQPPSVRELAAALVARQGGAEAARALAAALDDVLGDPNADERSVGMAVAFTRALARTGDTSRPVLEALGEAANEPLSAEVRKSAMVTIGQLCPAGAGEALHKGERDPDGGVQRAARSALERCHR